MKDYLNKLWTEVIGAVIEVHCNRGPGLLETSYELSLQHELALLGFASERQVVLPINYKDLVVPEAYRIDLLVEVRPASHLPENVRQTHRTPYQLSQYPAKRRDQATRA
jgi:hypothetical protein